MDRKISHFSFFKKSFCQSHVWSAEGSAELTQQSRTRRKRSLNDHATPSQIIAAFTVLCICVGSARYIKIWIWFFLKSVVFKGTKVTQQDLIKKNCDRKHQTRREDGDRDKRGFGRQEGKGKTKDRGWESEGWWFPSRPPLWLDLSLLMTLSAGSHRQMVN